MKQRFKLQQEEVQNASLGCEINQAGHVPAISEPGKPDYIKEDFPTVERGKYKVRISQPGLIREILELVNFMKDGHIKVNTSKLPMDKEVAKELDETMPTRKTLEKALLKMQSMRSKTQAYVEQRDTTDPFAPVDDSYEETKLVLNEKQRQEFKALAPIFKEHYRTLIGKMLYLSRLSRPDISTAVSILSRYVSEPRYFALKGLKQLCRY